MPNWFTENGYMPSAGVEGGAMSMPMQQGGMDQPAQGPAMPVAQSFPGSLPWYTQQFNAQQGGFAPGGPMGGGGAPGGGQQPFNYDAFRARAEELSRGSTGSNAEFVNRIYPQLAQEFGGLQRFGSKGDKIRLPTGEVIDAVISAGAGGKGYNWGIEQPGGGGQGSMPMGDVASMGALGWSGLGPMGAGGGGNVPNVGSIDAQALTNAEAYNPTATQGPDALSLGTITQPGTVTADQVKGPGALTAAQLAAPDQFRNLTSDEFLQDPSYQIREKRGLQAIQNAAAAKGLLRSGATLKGLSDYAGESASQEYAAANARKMAAAQMNFGQSAQQIAQNNAANAQAYGLTNQYQQGAQLANQAANLQAGQFNAGMNYNTQAQNIANQLAAYQAYQNLNQQNRQFNAGRTDTAAQQNFLNRYNVEQANNANRLAAFGANTQASLGAGNLALGYTQAANAYNLGLGNLSLGNKQADQSYNLGLGGQGLGWANFGLNQQAQDFGQGLQTFNTNYGVFRDNRDTAFNQNYALGQLGAGMAGNYGNSLSNLYTNQGNANAAANIARGNAWGGAIGNIGNYAQQGLYSWNTPRQSKLYAYDDVTGGGDGL